MPLADGVPESQSSEGQDSSPRGGPPWAVQVYRSPDGKLCGRPGQTLDGRVGQLDHRGRLHEYPLEGARCVDPTALPDSAPLTVGLTAYDFDNQTGRRAPVSLVWGLARSDVDPVTVELPQGRRRLRVADRGGAYVAAYPGDIVNAVRVTATLHDGREATVTLPEAPPELRERILNPPTGARLQAEGEEAERRKDDPSYHR